MALDLLLLDNDSPVSPTNSQPQATPPPPAPTVTPSSIGKEAQDVSKAQGVAYEGIATKAANENPEYASYDSGGALQEVKDTFTPKGATSYIDQAKNTVAGQLNTLLSSDSPYITAARTRAKEQASGRGMLNTSMAAGEAERAAIESGLPIAQQDAETYTKFGLQQQQSENQIGQIQAEAVVSGKLNEQAAAIKQTQQNIQNAFNARLQGATEQSQAWLKGLQNTHEVALANLNNTANAVLQQQQVSAQKAETLRTISSQVMQNYQISVENLMTDPDFLDLGPEAVNNAINQMQTLARNSIKFIGASSGIDMRPFVDTYLTSLTVR